MRQPGDELLIATTVVSVLEMESPSARDVSVYRNAERVSDILHATTSRAHRIVATLVLKSPESSLCPWLSGDRVRPDGGRKRRLIR